MKSKYVDISATINVIGNIYNNINLLDNEKYSFSEDDFIEQFHKIIFGTIYNLHLQGVKDININTIEDYLIHRPQAFATYQANKGREYLIQITDNVQLSTFDYYYQRLKKMTLFRMYEKVGMNLNWLYDPDNILNAKKKQEQENWLDNSSLEEIADLIDKKITEIKLKYVDSYDNVSSQAGEGCLELLEQLQLNPEFGYPLYGPLINTVTRGARLKKFYLRSAATRSWENS